MDLFSKELLRLGTLQGFLHFQCYLRGREELMVTIPHLNKQAAAHGELEGAGGKGQHFGMQHGGVDQFLDLVRHSPLEQQSPMKMITPDLSGKPPASPAQPDTTQEGSDDECVFLVGAYQRYQSPFVWLRTGHIENYSETDRDIPLKLTTTTNWQKTKSKAVHVVAELVKVTVRPRVVNPFAIDFDALESMPLVQSTFCSGALLHMLREMLLSGEHTRYEAYILGDAERLIQMHFLCFSTLADAAVQEANEDEAELTAQQDGQKKMASAYQAAKQI